MASDAGRRKGSEMCTSERPKRREELLAALASIAQYGQPPRDYPTLFSVGMEAYLQYFEREVLEALLVPGGSSVRFYEGAYGDGKTHFLLQLQHLGWRRGMAVAWIDLSQWLRLEDWQGLTVMLLERLTLSLDGECRRSLPEILALLGQDPARLQAVEALKRSVLPHAGFQQAMIMALEGRIVRPEARSVLAGFLTGKSVKQPEFKSVGLPPIKGMTKKNAKRVLQTALQGLRLLGVPGILVLIDETEQSFVSGSGRPQKIHPKIANWLRLLIDSAMVEGTFPGTGFVFTLLPGYLEQAGQYYPALSQRLQMISGPNGATRKAGWRWPFKPLDSIYVRPANEDPEEQFMRLAIKALVSELRRWGVALSEQDEEIWRAGRAALKRHAGSGYRRNVMKALAEAAFRRLRG